MAALGPRLPAPRVHSHDAGMAKIKVTAGKGRTVPVDRSLATAPGRRLLYLREGEVLEVEERHSGVQRALRDGDFVRVVDSPSATPPTPPSTSGAASPKE